MSTSEPQEHGTVRASLAGWGPDLAQLGLYLEGVTRGRNEADVLRELHLAAVVITEMHPTRGRGDRITMVFTLEPARP